MSDNVLLRAYDPPAPGGAGAAARAAQPDNTLTIVAGGLALTGWQSVRLTRGLDRVPMDFDIELTERYPGQASQVVVQPFTPCQVMIGKTTVLTGYIDRYMPSFAGRNHSVRIQGRSKCEDLVDCSITPEVLTGMQISTTSLLDLATRLAAPYGVTATSLTGNNVPVGAPGGGPLQFNAILTETPHEIIERVARYAGVLVYDGTDGNLLIANVGAATMASGFAQGVNVQAAGVTFSGDGRYSKYLPCLMSANFYGEQGIGGTTFTPAYDNGVPRFRELIVVSEQFQWGASLAQARAQWEAARRFGRSQAVRLTCDSWRDSAGALWQPNAYATVSLPALKLTPSVPWIIGEVTFRRDANGTTADLTLMPKQAFLPQPEILVPFLWDPSSGAPPANGGAAQTAPASQTGPGGTLGGGV